jgi:hypothetical protein
MAQAAVDPQNLGRDAEPVGNEILKMGREIDQQIGFGQGGEFAALALVPPPSRAFAWGDVFDPGP